MRAVSICSFMNSNFFRKLANIIFCAELHNLHGCLGAEMQGGEREMGNQLRYLEDGVNNSAK